MQAVAAELAGYAGKPPPLFELRRIPPLFGEESLKQFVSMLHGPESFEADRKAAVSFCNS